jgi:hypothetical protein
MTDLRTAAQQALEALESLFNWQVDPVRGQRCSDAITNLKAALEQPEQEPVAWMTPGQDLHLNNGEKFRFSDWTPLYTHPPRREWRGLSEEEFGHIYVRSATHEEFARAIEQALRSKNHE